MKVILGMFALGIILTPTPPTIADEGGGDEVLHLLLQSHTSDSDTRTPASVMSLL